MTPDSAPSLPAWLYLLRLWPRALRGKTRVARWLSARCGLSGAVKIQAQGLSWAVPSLSEPVAQGLLRDGVYEPTTSEVIRRHLPKDGALVDVGANVGMFSLMAAHFWAKEGKVLALEASPQIIQWLRYNHEQNPAQNLTVRHAAVTESSGGEISFFNAPDAKFGMGSLTNRFSSSAVKVKTVSVDDAVAEAQLGHVHVMKVDVEGHELGVFKGAAKLLAQQPAPLIVFEFNDWAENRDDGSRAGDAQRYLQSLGYQLQTVDGYLAGRRDPLPALEVGGADFVAWKL
jgi:FkbM family methyltransferase